MEYPSTPDVKLVRRAIAAAGQVAVPVGRGRTLFISAIDVEGRRWVTDTYKPNIRGWVSFSSRDAKLLITWEAMLILGDDDGATVRKPPGAVRFAMMDRS